MGQIVGAVFTTHVPRLMIFGEAERTAYMGRGVTTFYDAMERLYRERLARRDFDTFLVFDTHWFTTIQYVLNAAPRLEGIYTSEEVPELLHEHEFSYTGDPDLAQKIAGAAKERKLRVFASSYRGMPLHYPTLIPMAYFNPTRDRRVLSVGVCQTAAVHNDLAFGRAVGEGIRRSDRRVVLVAAGGLSHRFWEYDVVLEHTSADPAHISSAENRAFDERIMALFRRGDHAGVIAVAEEYRRRCAPEGRFAHYLMMIGALGEGRFTSPGVQYGNYESAIGTGQAIFWFDV
ncbi:MAG: catechol 1,2-dioxygenase [Thermodesulfobacteriota bacterium]|jgi:3,4-dihydroxyphenylacetate 2,3-dioxygenase